MTPAVAPACGNKLYLFVMNPTYVRPTRTSTYYSLLSARGYTLPAAGGVYVRRATTLRRPAKGRNSASEVAGRHVTPPL